MDKSLDFKDRTELPAAHSCRGQRLNRQRQRQIQKQEKRGEIQKTNAKKTGRTGTNRLHRKHYWWNVTSNFVLKIFWRKKTLKTLGPRFHWKQKKPLASPVGCLLPPISQCRRWQKATKMGGSLAPRGGNRREGGGEKTRVTKCQFFYTDHFCLTKFTPRKST